MMVVTVKVIVNLSSFCEYFETWVCCIKGVRNHLDMLIRV